MGSADPRERGRDVNARNRNRHPVQQECRTQDEDAEAHRSMAWDRGSPEAVLLVAVRSLR